MGENLLVLQFGQQKDVFRHPRKPFGFIKYDMNVLPALFLGQFVIFQSLCKAADGYNRRFEFVGEIVDEVIAEQFHIGEFFSHVIETVQNIADFGVVISSDFHTGTEISFCDSFGCLSDLCEGLGSIGRNQNGKNNADRYTAEEQCQDQCCRTDGAPWKKLQVSAKQEEHAGYDTGKQCNQEDRKDDSESDRTAALWLPAVY